METKRYTATVDELPTRMRTGLEDVRFVDVQLRAKANKSQAAFEADKKPLTEEDIFEYLNKNTDKKRSFAEIRAALKSMPKLTPISDFTEEDLYDEFGLPV